MDLEALKYYLPILFGEDKLVDDSEWGFTIESGAPITKVGYATNLVPETIELAARDQVDLLITHHDAWDFIHGMKTHCIEDLRRHNMSHLFVHLPLDDADFGTNVSLLEGLGATVVERTHRDGAYSTGAIGEYGVPVDFDELVRRMEGMLGEPVAAWRNHARPIRRVGVVTGAGLSTHDVHEAVEKKCDVYITGERVLYTVQYAKFAGINLLVGSHTFTEIFGVERLARRVQEAFPEIEIIRIKEEHLETTSRR